MSIPPPPPSTPLPLETVLATLFTPEQRDPAKERWRHAPRPPLDRVLPNTAPDRLDPRFIPRTDPLATRYCLDIYDAMDALDVTGYDSIRRFIHGYRLPQALPHARVADLSTLSQDERTRLDLVSSTTSRKVHPLRFTPDHLLHFRDHVQHARRRGRPPKSAPTTDFTTDPPPRPRRTHSSRPLPHATSDRWPDPTPTSTRSTPATPSLVPTGETCPLCGHPLYQSDDRYYHREHGVVHRACGIGANPR